MRRALVGVLCGLLLPGLAGAQVRMRGQGMVRGLAYDSLARSPLAGADVWVQGSQLRTRTDSAGQFRFDDLLDGRYVLVLSHEGLDSVGVYNLAAPVTVETGRVATAFLTTPSLATIWARRCSGAEAPATQADSGVLVGLVTDAATSHRLAGAEVVATWLALKQEGNDVTAEPRAVAVRTDSIGWYYACGLSTDVTLHVRAYGAGDSTGAIQKRPASRPLARRDFTIGRGRTAAIRGTVTGPDGQLVAAARVTVDSNGAVTTGDGRFLLANLPSGTQWLSVRAVGRAPLDQAVDLHDGDTLDVVLPLGANAVLLDAVRVVTTRYWSIMQGIEDRKRRGFGTIRTEADLIGRHDIVSTLQAMPSLRVERRRGSIVLVFPGRSMGGLGGCLASVYLDGFRVGYDELLAYSPDELLAIEVYPRGQGVPLQYATTNSCGVVLVWTKFLQ